jgi:hypothetical protein
VSAHPRKLLKEISRFLEHDGISVVGDQIGGRHRKLRVTDGTRYATILVSISPSDHRAYYNIAKTARHALREAP